MNVPKYLEASTREQKSKVIFSVVKMLQGEIEARFFKMKGGKYIELNDKQIRQKVGHALRDMAVQRTTGSSPASKRLSLSSIGSAGSSGSLRETNSLDSAIDEEKGTSSEPKPAKVCALSDDFIDDDMSIDEGFFVCSAEIFPDIVTPETPLKSTRQEVFGKMLEAIDDLSDLLQTDQYITFDDDFVRAGFVAEKAVFQPSLL